MFRHWTDRLFTQIWPPHLKGGAAREISPPQAGSKLKHVILTLDPNKFAEKKQQRLRIGNLQAFTPRVSLPKRLTPIKDIQRIHYDHSERVALSYPQDTKAFLYYYMSPGKPRIGGELRLRLTSSDHPASFESGSDLLRADGQPWSRPLYALPKCYPPLYEKLREEQFVPDDLDAALSTMPSRQLRYRTSQLLYTLNDTFIVDFSNFALKLFVVTEQGLETLPLYDIFVDWRRLLKSTPYTGSALARFERSTLPDHKGIRTVVLRFLKIITPVKCVMPSYDGYIYCPKEGELFRKTSSRRMDQPVWSVNIDKTGTMRGLQLLWDT